MAEIRWTEEAKRWLRKIHECIAEDNPAAADRTIEGIYKQTQLLATSTRLGFRYPNPSGREVCIMV